MAPQVPCATLNTGYKMPMIGLGTWKSLAGKVESAVKDAIELGYRHIDCAHVYGNEKEVGAAIRTEIEAGVIKREELFVTSKLWNTFHRPDLVEPALRQSLSNLGLDYLDLYLIHWPMAYKEEGDLFPKDGDRFLYSDVDYVDTWLAMEKCVSAGLVRSIGVSNFNSEQLQRVIDAGKIKPAANQVECHPYLNQQKLMDYCSSKGIVITAYSPLGSPDRPWAKPDEPQLLEDPRLLEVAERYKKTPAQVLLHYQVQRNNVAIPKSVTRERIKENFDIFNFELSPDDMAFLNSLDVGGRFCHAKWLNDHPQFPFNIEF